MLNLLSSQQHAVLQDAKSFRDIYDNSIYDGLVDWWTERDEKQRYVPIRKRKPAVKYNLAKAICQRPADFMMGETSFPQFAIPEAPPETSKLLEWFRNAHLMKACADASVDACVEGSAAITIHFSRGKLRLRNWRRSQAWPVLDEAQDLLGLVVLYQGLHQATGNTVWWRLTLDAMNELWEYSDSQAATSWTTHSSVPHNLGFVPAVWIRQLSKDPSGVEGTSLLKGIEDHCRGVDYTFSRRDRALSYSADPQPVIKDKDPAKTEANLTKSPAGTWLLSEDGDAFYLEITGKGLEMQQQYGDDLRRGALEISRVVLPDPERIRGQAMSGYALRILYESMIDLCDRLKVEWEPAMTELTNKTLLAMRILLSRNTRLRIPNDNLIAALSVVNIPQPLGDSSEQIQVWHPWISQTRAWTLPLPVEEVAHLTITWGPYFETSPDEENTLVTSATAAKSARIISTETATRYVAPKFGVGDVAAELARIQLDDLT